MALLDTLKGLVKGRERQVKEGIEKVSNVVESKAGKHASKVDAASDKLKDAVDKLGGERATGTSTPSTPASTPASTTPPTTPPPTTP